MQENNMQQFNERKMCYTLKKQIKCHFQITVFAVYLFAAFSVLRLLAYILYQ